MERNLALKLASQLIPDEKSASSLKITKEAKKEIDQNNDGKISQEELAKGFENDKVVFNEKTKKVESAEEPKVSNVNKVTFFSGNKPEENSNVREEMTYKPEQWYKDPFNPNVGNPNSNFKGISGRENASVTYTQMKNVIGKDFNTAAQTLTTPYDIAFLAGSGIKYDYDRADKSEGPGGTYSPQEVLTSGTGVCRDTHTLAVALLRANGYDAKQLGYSSADDTFHAFAVYQDPKTGKWGALEYGRVYPPEMLNADSPQEAFLMVRPDALVITDYEVPKDPNDRTTENKVFYTPTVREYNSFVFGKHSGDASLNYTNTGVQVSGKIKDWEYAVRYNQPNQMTPVLDNSSMVGVWKNFDKAGLKIGIGGGYLPNMFTNSVGPNEKVALPTGIAFASVEGNHPKVIGVENIGGTEINLALNSKFIGVGTLAFNKSGDIKDADGNVTEENQKIGYDMGVSNGLSRFNWNPDITINREFDVWGGKNKDLNLYAKYGTDFDSQVLVSYYRGGGTGVAVTQFALAGAEAKIDNEGKYKVGAGVYAPIGHVYSNDYASEPMVNLKISTPYVSFSTSHGQNTHIYTLDSGVDLTKGKVDTRLEAFASLEDDQINKTFTPKAGARLNFKF